MTPSALTLRIGDAMVTLHEGWTVTRFTDGREVVARHDDVAGLGQAQTAAELGYPDVATMNAEHDVFHSLLAAWFGLRGSPTLRGMASGNPWPQAWMEEAAVLALQRFAVATGRSARMLAQRRER